MTNFCETLDFFSANKLLRPKGERANAERREGVGVVTLLHEMTLSNAKASVTRLSNTFHIFHRAHSSRRYLSLSHSLVLFARNENSSKYCRRCSFVNALASVCTHMPASFWGERTSVHTRFDDSTTRSECKYASHVRASRNNNCSESRERENQVRPRLRTVMGAWVIKWGPLLSPGGGAPSITHIVPPIPSFFPPEFVPRAAAPGRIYSDRPEEFCPGRSRQREIPSNLSAGVARVRNFSKMMVMRLRIFANFRYKPRPRRPRTWTRKGFSRENREVERADNTFAATYIHDHIPPLVSPHPPNNSGVVQSRRRAAGNPGV